MVNPLRHVLDGQVLRLARRGVHHDHALDGRSAEQADGARLHGADPPRLAFLVDLERLLVEHVEGVFQLHVAVDVAHERLGLGVMDGVVLKAHDLRILRRHVHQRVGGDAGLAVREPLEQVRIPQRAHAHRRALVVDLAVQRRYLELAHVLGDGAHLAVAQQHGRIAVDNGDLRVVHLLDVLREVVLRRLQHRGVLLGVAGEDGERHHGAQDAQHGHGHRHVARELERLRLARVRLDLRGALLVAVRTAPEHQEQRQQDEHGHEHPGVRRMDVDGRVEPPVGGQAYQHDNDGGDDKGLLAPRGHTVRERDLNVNVRRLRASAASPAGATRTVRRGLRVGVEAPVHVDPRLPERFKQRIDSGCLFHGIPFRIPRLLELTLHYTAKRPLAHRNRAPPLPRLYNRLRST